ncbi:KAH7997583.1hypothetical protein K3G42_002894 [Podarcis lilfordi]|uniref:Uncharacterized protein n=1 Tax=Podarcis lilfordi TaxID=74358 RepID=A0AA35LH45_9SAUR|nr:KAH7997583.1hypothetical protein K3G42_002894 [Podarcis lilfordi]
MGAVIKKSRRDQCSCQRKTQRNQTRQGKPQAKQARKTRTKEVTKHVKKLSQKKGPGRDKECQLTKKAREDLSSYVEGLCKVVTAEADRLRKEKSESTISREVLVAALEQSLSQGSMTPGIKKTKKKEEASVEVAKRMPSPSEQQASSNQKLPKPRKRSAAPV